MQRMQQEKKEIIYFNCGFAGVLVKNNEFLDVKYLKPL